MALGNSAPAARTPLADSINRLQWVCRAFGFPFQEVKMLYLYVHPKAGNTVHVQGWQDPHTPLPLARYQSVPGSGAGWQQSPCSNAHLGQHSKVSLPLHTESVSLLIYYLIINEAWLCCFPLISSYAQPILFAFSGCTYLTVNIQCILLFSLSVRIFY